MAASSAGEDGPLHPTVNRRPDRVLLTACCTNPEIALIGCLIEPLTRAFGKRVVPETALCNRLLNVNLAELLKEWRCPPCRSPALLVSPPGSAPAYCWPRSVTTWRSGVPLRCTPRWATRCCPCSSPPPTAAVPAATGPGATGPASIPGSPAAYGKPPPTRPWCCAPECSSTWPTWTANPVWRRFAPP